MTGRGGAVLTLPIAPHQEEIYDYWRRNPRSSAFNMVEVVHLEGDVDVVAAEFALNELVRRHEALRTTFHPTDAGVVQIIDDAPAPVPIEVVDLRRSEDDSRSQQLAATIHGIVNGSFDLSAEPPIKLAVIKVTDRHTSVVVIAHHIACDGVSMSILLDEFRTSYRATRGAARDAAAETGPGYSSFTQATLAALDDGTLDAARAFWCHRLTGAVGGAFPASTIAPTVAIGRSGTYARPTVLDEETTRSLHRYARAERTTPFAVLLCALHVTMTAAGQPDVALRTATSGRTPEFANTVGMLSNVVVSRARLDLSSSFTAALTEVSLDLMDAIDHSDVPFSTVVDDLRAADREAELRSIRTEFTAGIAGETDLGMGAVTSEVAYTDDCALDLLVNCHFEPPIVAIDWMYSLARYTRRAADGYCRAYHEILETALSRPDEAMTALGVGEIVRRAGTNTPEHRGER